MRNLHSPIMNPFDEFKGEGVKEATPPLPIEEVMALFEAVMAEHMEHEWEQLGRCVWCWPCGVRLYQGRVPDDHPMHVRVRGRSMADQMRERWGMDTR